MENANALKPTTIPQLVDFLGIKFNRNDEKFEAVDKKINDFRLELTSELNSFKDDVHERFKEVHLHFDDLEERIFPTLNDREDLEALVFYIEKKLKIKFDLV